MRHASRPGRSMRVNAWGFNSVFLEEAILERASARLRCVAWGGYPGEEGDARRARSRGRYAREKLGLSRHAQQDRTPPLEGNGDVYCAVRCVRYRLRHLRESVLARLLMERRPLPIGIPLCQPTFRGATHIKGWKSSYRYLKSYTIQRADH